jgi:beta-mannosidase
MQRFSGYGFLCVIILTIFLFSCDHASVKQIQLSSNWYFSNDTFQVWLPASVPGSVHTDLYSIDKIPDPFFGGNEQKLQWIGESEWYYTSTFDANLIHDYKHVELVFDGLDTYADVFLNDSLILKADNMFRQWIVDVKGLLNADKNELIIHFKAPEPIEQKKAAQLPYQLPDVRGFTRKAPYQYGWDWGPKFLTAGIWKSIYLRGWNDLRILEVHIWTAEILKGEAIIGIEAKIESVKDANAQIEVLIDNQTHSQSTQLQKGTNTYRTLIKVREPRLWWPNGMGDQPLYTLNFTVKNGHTYDSKKTSFGIRKVELVQNKDAIGESFYFKINDVPFFAKGANYIPQDNFPSRVSDEKYVQTIQQAVDANMNMLRVWGGGFYERDMFYNLCDQKGILVWQDFMFACNMYPGDTAFLHNVRKEAEYQVKRLRNHPSLALWCGNNEISEGWHNWGWQQALNYSEKDSMEIWHNYLKIFDDILPQTVFDNSPSLSYISSSPKIGWGHEEALHEGDMHYWGVWWGEEPFEIYEEKVGRFMSEYGFQGMPDLRTWDSCLNSTDKNLHSAALLNHQKHPRGMELIQTYMERDFPVPDHFEEYNYVSQLVQAYGITMAIEAQRRAMPRCMGSLYWQLNDCWPVISWSSVDYYNRWKALHYHTRDAYKEVLISFGAHENEVSVFVVSDRRVDIQAELDLKIIDFKGDIQWQEKQQLKIQKAFSSILKKVDIAEIIKEDHVLVATLKAGDSLIAQNLYYFVAPKLLRLHPAEISYRISPVKKGYLIEISSDKLVKNIGLMMNRDGHFSNNYFDLLPGEVRNILFVCDPVSEDPDLKIITLNDLLN